MRAEELELEGPDLEHEQRVESSHREAHEEEELPVEGVGEEIRDTGFEHRSRLFDALRLILAREQVNLTLLYLPQRETLALEALQAAVTGADAVGEFVFAEDRRILLEQALAVLQQNLTSGDPAQLAELQSRFDAMTAQVGELRERLVDLEDAQEELDEFHNAARKRLGADDAAGDKDDQPKPDATTPLVDVLAAQLGSTLADGPEVAPAPKPPSSLSTGPAVAERPAPPSTLAAGGPEAVPAPKRSSLSDGPEVVDAPARSSLSDGPEAVAPPKRSSLYDEADARAAGTATATHDPAPQRRAVKKPEPEPPKKGRS